MHRTYDTWKSTEPDWNADEFYPCEGEPEPTLVDIYDRNIAKAIIEVEREIKSAGPTRKR